MSRFVYIFLCLSITSFCSSFAENVPEWRTNPEDVTATAGDPVRLVCSFTPLADDDPKPRWLHFSVTISKGDTVYSPRFELSENVSAGNYSLLIRNVTLEDEGTWKCSHILARPQTRSAYLTVKDAKGEDSNGSETASSTMKTIVTSDMKGGESSAHLMASPNMKIVVFSILFSLAIPLLLASLMRSVFTNVTAYDLHE
ncbi:uncharacterized protein [Ptychodera flava]|uniref:uncharacterized protein n=1 Tax=Ptychodera flava TaxID=63121 RepID=UPI00396A05A0